MQVTEKIIGINSPKINAFGLCIYKQNSQVLSGERNETQNQAEFHVDFLRRNLGMQGGDNHC